MEPALQLSDADRKTKEGGFEYADERGLRIACRYTLDKPHKF